MDGDGLIDGLGEGCSERGGGCRGITLDNGGIGQREDGGRLSPEVDDIPIVIADKQVDDAILVPIGNLRPSIGADVEDIPAGRERVPSSSLGSSSPLA